MDHHPLADDGLRLRRLDERVRVLSEAMRAFAEATPDYGRLLETIVRSLARALGDTCGLRVVSDDGEGLEPVAFDSRNPAAARRMREHPGAPLRLAEQPAVRAVLASGAPLLVPRVDPAALRAGADGPTAELMEALETHGLLLAPLRLHGEPIGLLTLSRHGASAPFDEHDRDLAADLAELAALAVAHARLLRASRRELAARQEADREVAARKRAELRFARLADAGVLGILVSDLRGRVVEVNDTLLTMVGRSREEACAPHFRWPDLTPPECRAAEDLAVEQLQCMGVAGLREQEYLRPDGTRVPVLVGTAMLEGPGGEAISFMLNLTERKHAEREAAALREARQADAVRFRLAAIVDSSDDAIIGETLDGVIESWNLGAERMFGYAAEEVIGRSIAILDPEPDPAGPRPTGARFGHHEARRRRKDGSLIDVSMTLSPVRDADGAVVGASKVVRDVTERKRADEALARARESAELANRELEAFSYSVAHDLRAPLRGMSGFANVLLEDYGGRLDAEGQDCLEEIQSNAAKMGALIDALLSLSRVTRSELRPQPVDLSALARAVAAQLAAADPGRRVEVVVEDGLTAAVDAVLARALLDNLLANAWKFTGRAERPRVEFGSATERGERAFFVRDNGAGFDMAHAKKLFAAFQRLHTVGEFPGTGIGLATVQRIVRRHGGRVWADGRVGDGATFYFTLPLRAAEVPP